MYVPRAGSEVTDPQETFLHGTSMRFLWSILAHGGTRRPCVWVIHSAPEAAGCCSAGYLEDGNWFQVMACVDRRIVDPHPGTTKQLGGSGKQTRVATPFLEICGIAFRAFRVKSDRETGHATSASFIIHGHRISGTIRICRSFDSRP